MLHSPENVLDHDLAFSSSLLGKECAACRRAYIYKKFKKDSSSRDGHANLCNQCLNTPRLNIEENYHRYREMNENSAAVEAQRRPDELDYLERDSIGRWLWHSDFISKLRELLGVNLIVGDAYFLDEFSLYIIDSRCVDTNGVRYIGFIPSGRIQEFSSYKYDRNGVPIDETHRGYRGVLLKLIIDGYLTEQEVNKVFGFCDEKIWAKTLYNYRNQKRG
jgi:hypothetical protein